MANYLVKYFTKEFNLQKKGFHPHHVPGTRRLGFSRDITDGIKPVNVHISEVYKECRKAKIYKSNNIVFAYPSQKFCKEFIEKHRENTENP